jgi:HlyD family secretion protein
MKELTRPGVPLNGIAKIEVRQKKSPKRVYWIVAAVVLIVAIVAALVLRPKAASRIVTAPVAQQTLVSSVTATGTVNPQDTISVGTQVSGTIQTIYADFNDRVYQGEVLARLDPTPFQAALDQNQATLAQAQAQYEAAVAGAASTQTGVAKAQAALALAKQTLSRDQALLHNGYIAQSQYDTDNANLVANQSALNSAVAQTTQAQGTVAAAQAAVQAAQAQVQQAQINLAHSVITSPVNGTVIARNVSVGQTVAASFQTPTLYTIAKDLGKMEVDLAVGEPDIGAVRANEPVNFTVLAYPNYTFRGKVAQVRENPTTVQNVVTYDTVVYVNNPRGMLMPGMTADASIQTATANNALVVPLEALAAGSYAAAQHARGSASSAGAGSSPWGNAGTAQTQTIIGGTLGRVLVVNGRKLQAIPVRVTLVSGDQAAVVPQNGTSLTPGEQVVVSFGTSRAATTSQTQSPARGFGMLR